MVPFGNNLGLCHSPDMSSNPNEWNLLKEEFDALCVTRACEDSLEQSLDYQVRRHFGELIASSAGHETAGYYGWTKGDYAAWPPDPGHANR